MVLHSSSMFNLFHIYSYSQLAWHKVSANPRLSIIIEIRLLVLLAWNSPRKWLLILGYPCISLKESCQFSIPDIIEEELSIVFGGKAIFNTEIIKSVVRFRRRVTRPSTASPAVLTLTAFFIASSGWPASKTHPYWCASNSLSKVLAVWIGLLDEQQNYN